MILIARTYLEELLEQIGVKKVFPRLSALGNIKPPIWAVIENPDPEEYSPNYERMFTDEGKIRTYHIKHYDATLVLTVRLGGMKDITVNTFKREFLKKLKKWIEDSEGYRMDIAPLSGDLNPEESELAKSPTLLIRVRFTGGLWQREEAPLIKDVILVGEIVPPMD